MNHPILKSTFLNTLRKNKRAAALLLFLLITLPAFSREIIPSDPNPFWDFSFKTDFCYFQPVGEYKNLFEPGKGASFSLSYNPKIMDYLTFNLTGAYLYGKFKNNTQYNYYLIPVSVGANYELPIPKTDFSANAGLGIGFYYLEIPEQNNKNPYARAGAGIDYKIDNNFAVGASIQYHHFFDSKQSIQGLTYSGSLTWNFGQPNAEKDILIEQINIPQIFASNYEKYVTHLGDIMIKNNTEKKIEDISVYIEIDGLLKKSVSGKTVPSLAKNERAKIPVNLLLPAEALLKIKPNSIKKMNLLIEYVLNNKEKGKLTTIPIQCYSINQINWQSPTLGFFTTYMEPKIQNLSKNMIQEPIQIPFEKNINYAFLVFSALKSLDIKYLKDPKNNLGTIDTINFPLETLRSRFGDCDDLSTLFVSFLESLSIPCAYIITYDHIFAMFEIKSSIPYSVQWKGRYWIPIETTSLQTNFFQAWKDGFNLFNKYNEKTIITAQNAIKENAPCPLDFPYNISLNTINFKKILSEDLKHIDMMKDFNFDTFYNLSFLHYKNNDIPSALNYMLFCYDKDKDNPNVVYFLIKYYIALKDKTNAKKYKTILDQINKKDDKDLSLEIENLTE